MARRLGRRKEPLREDFMLKEQLKIEEGVFDRRTIMAIGKVFTRNVVSRMRFIIARGKEADVYLADAGDKVDADFVVLKIFRLETSSFKARIDYITGDRRFQRRISTDMQLISTWCRKEFGNLRLAHNAKVHSPAPYTFENNVLAMEFIGNGNAPAPRLKETVVDNPSGVLDTVLKDIGKLYSAGLVHGDVSEYNILMSNGTPFMIDFGQAVTADHPKAQAFLERDVGNILAYFRKRYGVERDVGKIVNEIRSMAEE
jgi:RIO kinase 1